MSDADRRRLVAPTIDRVGDYLDMIDSALSRGETGDGYALNPTAAARSNPAAFVERLRKLERGEDLPTGFVPTATRWLLDGDGTLVGETRLRATLNDALRIEGGHVGYFVGTAARGLGHGTAILRLALIELRHRGVGRVLVTCDADNLRSRRVIERNGGRFDRDTVSPRTGKPVATFWIG